MLVDDVTISVRGGKGGNGMVAFNKIPMHLGPAGGDGGRGGDVYAEGVSDLGALLVFRNTKDVYAEDGENGKAQFNDGRNGEDKIFKVPIGTVLHDLRDGTAVEVTHVGERVLLARGGRGGTGNYKFRSAHNTSPYEQTDGKKGEEKEIRLELKMIADVGFIGLPNAGKSSLINALTKAQSKVGNYKFTTLEAHLGDYYGLIIADIPGLIEGAAEGKGLGGKFLRHIERTKVLFHLVAVDSEQPLEDYHIIRAELGRHNPGLLEKKEQVLLSKIDEVTPERLAEIQTQFSAEGIDTMPISVIDDTTLAPLKKVLNQLKDEKLGQSTQ
jgi:GTP-binding protein